MFPPAFARSFAGFPMKTFPIFLTCMAKFMKEVISISHDLFCSPIVFWA